MIAFIDNIIRNRRRIKFVKRWNNDLDYIWEETKKTKDGHFKWRQLVTQEIEMWINLKEQVTPEDFSFICQRRGFNEAMKKYLKNMLIYLGIGKRLK